MFKNLSLKNKLAISASAAIILGGVLVEGLSFRDSLNRLDVEVAQRLESTSASYNQYVKDWLLSKERALTSLSSDSEKRSLVTHLKQVRDSGAFDNVFLAYPDGSQDNANGVVLPPGNNDPRKWGWYTMQSPTHRKSLWITRPLLLQLVRMWCRSVKPCNCMVKPSFWVLT